MWLAGEFAPSADGTNAYSPTTASGYSNGKYTFMTSRALDTGDSKDFKIECGKSYNFKWAGCSTSANTSNKHDKLGAWSLSLDADCSIRSDAAGAASLIGGSVALFTGLITFW